MGGFSIWHWLIVLVIVVLVFGTKRLKNVGKDLGDAVKGFKDGVREKEDADPIRPPAQLTDQQRADQQTSDPQAADPLPRGDATTADPASGDTLPRDGGDSR